MPSHFVFTVVFISSLRENRERKPNTMKSLSILFPVIAILVNSTLALDEDLYRSYVDDVFVEIVRRPMIPKPSSLAAAASSLLSKNNQQEPIIDTEITVRKIRMTADDVQDDLRLLGWEEDFRAADIGRSGYLSFPDGLDVLAIRKLSGPWRSSCYVIPLQEDVDDEDDEDDEADGEVTMKSIINKQEKEGRKMEEDGVDQEEEEKIIEPLDQMAILEAEAARDGIRRIPLETAQEFLTIRGIVCVRRAP